MKEAEVISYRYKKKKTPSKDFREINGKYYKEKDDIWYVITLQTFSYQQANEWAVRFKTDVLYQKPFHEVNGYSFKTHRYETPYGDLRNAICTDKRQLNKKEIKKLGLREKNARN